MEKEKLANQIANFEAHAESAGKHGGKAREAVTFGRRGKVMRIKSRSITIKKERNNLPSFVILN